jgi:hypothetical protein
MVAPMALIPPHIASQKFAELIARPDVAAMLTQQIDGVSYSGAKNSHEELGHFTSQVITSQEQTHSTGRRL